MKKRGTKTINGTVYYQCTSCHVFKTTESFQKDRRSKMGTYSKCRECCKTYRKSPERQSYIRLYQREWIREKKIKFFSGKFCYKCGTQANLMLKAENGCKIHEIKPWNKPDVTANFSIICRSCFLELTTLHGSGSRYRAGCRCVECKRWKKEARRRWRKRVYVRKSSGNNEPIPEFWPFIPHGLESILDDIPGIDLVISVYNCVPKGIPETVREDICQDILVGLLTGEISKIDLENRGVISRYIRENYKFSFPLGEISIDLESEHSGKSLLEKIH